MVLSYVMFPDVDINKLLEVKSVLGALLFIASIVYSYNQAHTVNYMIFVNVLFYYFCPLHVYSSEILFHT